MTREKSTPPTQQQEQQRPTTNTKVIDVALLEQSFQNELLQIKQLPTFFHDRRHEPNFDIPKRHVVDWRMTQRLKTVHVALVLCLNIGVDPPDVIRVHPCAKLEAWTDPFSLPHQRALETIGANLKAQYERWQPRARYKQCLDPTVEEIQKTCKNLRRSAKKERILFHYNGHGVPKPSANGEIWVFNKNFTEYIPLSLYDLSSWMDSPSIYVFDCPSAGTVLDTFVQVFKQKEKESGRATSKNKENIILAACGANESLPMNPNFPADLFTACLTTPIKIALRWFCENNRLLNSITVDMIEHIPGRINDRRTPLGELNWIFTAVTDTIAWSVLPRDLFHKLFRQDLLVASLFRNFLLADRIMRTANCTPLSYPKLPPTHNHEMWAAWDLALDMCISQLPRLIENPLAEYEYSSFFSAELTDFEVWLDFGQRKKEAPKQLPILLQVLLSQAHRLRALTLLGRFLDMGSWAINLSLSVGIFPYVLKLLQSNSPDLKQILVFIWAKILSVDQSCQYDLVKDNGHIYFINIVNSKSNDVKLRAMACFVLTVIANRFSGGQCACLHYNNMLNMCVSQFSEKSSHLRQWLCLLIGKLVENYPEAQNQALSQNLHEKVGKLLSDKVPEVRAAAVYCLQCFVRYKPNENQDRAENPQEEPEPLTEERIVKEMQVGAQLYQVILDGSPLVRRELIFALATFIERFGEHISPELLRTIIDEYTLASPASPPHDGGLLSKKKKKKRTANAEKPVNRDRLSRADINSPRDMKDRDLGSKSYFALDLCRVVLMLCSDPLPTVSSLANQVLRYMKKNFLRYPSVDDDRSKKHSSIVLSTSPPHNRSKSPIQSILSPSPAARLSNRFFIRRSVSETDINQISKQQQQHQTAVETVEDASLPSSIYYEWCCEYFATPLLNENQADTVPLTNGPITSPRSPLGTENEEPETSIYANVTKKALNRKKRQDQLIYERQVLIKNVTQPAVGKRKLEDQIGFFGNETDIVSHMKFHAIEPWLVVADERDGVSIWNWVKGVKINGWSVSSTFRSPVPNPTLHHSQSTFVGSGSSGSTTSLSGSDEDSYDGSSDTHYQYPVDPIFGDMRITDFQLVNENCADERSLLLVATSRGNVCFYANYHHNHKMPRMLTAIKAAPEVISRDQGPGVLTCWQQRTGTLIVGGDLEHVKIWDMNREWCIQSIPLAQQDNDSSIACVTSLASDQTKGTDHIFVAGLSDGSLMLYDKRLGSSGSKYNAVARLKEKGDDEWIVNVHMQKMQANTIISGNSSGIIKFWDNRYTDQSVKTIDVNDNSGTATLTSDALLNIDENLLSGGIGGGSGYVKKSQKSCMTALAIHDYAPVMACGSNNQFIKVLNTSGETLSMIYYHDGFLGQRIGPVSSLAFHPYRMCLAAGSTDSIISLYASSNT